jgi:Mrp family chromosome partitioning ATPase
VSGGQASGGQASGREGLSELLSNGRLSASGAAWYRYTIETGVPNLTLLPAGSPPADPLLLSNSEQMTRLLRRLDKHADIVLISAPPVLVAADALVLSAQASATLLVIQERVTRSKWAAQALVMLRNAQANVLGAVLTGAHLQSSDPPPHCDFGQPVDRRVANPALTSQVRTYSDGHLSAPELPDTIDALALVPPVDTIHLNSTPGESTSLDNGGNGYVS